MCRFLSFAFFEIRKCKPGCECELHRPNFTLGRKHKGKRTNFTHTKWQRAHLHVKVALNEYNYSFQRRNRTSHYCNYSSRRNTISSNRHTNGQRKSHDARWTARWIGSASNHFSPSAKRVFGFVFTLAQTLEIVAYVFVLMATLSRNRARVHSLNITCKQRLQNTHFQLLFLQFSNEFIHAIRANAF